jgi:hypothetical protein
MKRILQLSFLMVAFMAASTFFTQANTKKLVLFVHGPESPGLSDQNIINALETKFDVIAMDDDVATVEDANGADVVVISSTVASGKVFKFAWIAKPIINWEAVAMDDFGLTMTFSGDFPDETKQVLVPDNTRHPMLRGFANGANTIVEAINQFSTATPYTGGSKPAKVLATTNSDPAVPAWVIWEKGDDLDPAASAVLAGYPADGKSVDIRIYVPFQNNSFETANPLGLKLIMNSVEYAATGTVVASTKSVSAQSLLTITNDKLFLNAENVKSMSIYNTLGREIMNVRNNFEKGISISNLEQGAYIVSVETSNGVFSTKLMKR